MRWTVFEEERYDDMALSRQKNQQLEIHIEWLHLLDYRYCENQSIKHYSNISNLL